MFQHGLHDTLIAGALAIWSKETLIRIAPKYESMRHEYGTRSKFEHNNCVDRDGATEERTTSRCLRQLNISAEDTWDYYGREKVLIWAVSDNLVKKRFANSTGWYYKYKPLHVGTEENCCSETPIAFHNYKRASNIKRINDLLYSLSNTEVADSFEDQDYMKSLLQEPDKKCKTLVRRFPHWNLGLYRQIKYFHNIRKNIQDLYGELIVT